MAIRTHDVMRGLVRSWSSAAHPAVDSVQIDRPPNNVSGRISLSTALMVRVFLAVSERVAAKARTITSAELHRRLLICSSPNRAAICHLKDSVIFLALSSRYPVYLCLSEDHHDDPA